MHHVDHRAASAPAGEFLQLLREIALRAGIEETRLISNGRPVHPLPLITGFRLAADEVEWTVNDSKARLLFVGHEYAALVASVRARLPTVERVVVIGGPADEYEAFLAQGAPLTEPLSPEEDDCFLQLYTSGTTGFPKGAMLTHRSVGSHTQVMIDQFSFDETSVSLVPMPLFHVGGICWALLSLHCGAVSVMTRDPSPPAMLKDFVNERVSHTFIVPAILQGFLSLPDFASYDLSALKTVAYGASPIPRPVLEKVLAAMHCDFMQVYGMTEMSGVFCALDGKAHRDPAHRERLASAGRITPGTELRVVDTATGQPVTPGASGEFWVRGEQRLREVPHAGGVHRRAPPQRHRQGAQARPAGSLLGRPRTRGVRARVWLSPGSTPLHASRVDRDRGPLPLTPTARLFRAWF